MGGEVFSAVLVQTEISRQISDGLPRNVVQTFVRMNHADFGDSPELSSSAIMKLTFVVFREMSR